MASERCEHSRSYVEVDANPAHSIGTCSRCGLSGSLEMWGRLEALEELARQVVYDSARADSMMPSHIVQQAHALMAPKSISRRRYDRKTRTWGPSEQTWEC